MLFLLLLGITALSIASTAAFFSIIGLASIFTGAFIPVVIMGSVLEAGKLVAASFLYRFWDKTKWLMKLYLIFAIIVLMIITSAGIFGQLSAGYQQDTLNLKELESTVALLNQETDRLQERKKEIDKQISQMPENYVTARQKLMKTFEPELNVINARIPEITKSIQEMTSKKLAQEVHVGPIIYIAKVFDQEIDDATKWLILLIIFAFDPLAIALTLAFNMAQLDYRSRKKLIQPAAVTVASDVASAVQTSEEQDVSIPPSVPSVTSDTATGDIMPPAGTPLDVQALQNIINRIDSISNPTLEELNQKAAIQELLKQRLI